MGLIFYQTTSTFNFLKATNQRDQLFSLWIFFFFFFLGLHLQHMEVSRLGVELELQLLAYGTAMQDLSCICNLHCSLQQHQILNLPNKARD